MVLDHKSKSFCANVNLQFNVTSNIPLGILLKVEALYSLPNIAFFSSFFIMLSYEAVVSQAVVF